MFKMQCTLKPGIGAEPGPEPEPGARDNRKGTDLATLIQITMSRTGIEP